MKKMKSVLAVLLSAAMGVSLAACGSQGGRTNDQANDRVNDQVAETSTETENNVNSVSTGEKPTGIQTGTTFKYCINYDVPCYLPWIDNRAGGVLCQLYSNLVYKYHGDTKDVRGDLAESWTTSEDGLTWVFKLREGVVFSNGNEVTAEAFVKSWDAAKKYQPRLFESVNKYEATDKHELTVTLNTPSPTFIYNLPMVYNTSVVDPEALTEFGPEDNRSAIGCGPYYVEKYTSGEGFILKANENYFNPDKMPSIETCEFVIIPDENTAMMALIGEKVDLIRTTSMETVNNLEKAGWDLLSVPAQNHPWWFNAREVEIFRDATVREALCHMIDWNAINTLVYNNRYIPLESYVPANGSYPYDKEDYAYNPELGIKMLEDAGYNKDDIKFNILTNQDFKDMGVAMVGQFNDLGFNNITTECADISTCLGAIKGGTYEVTTSHNGYSPESPHTPYTMGLLPDGAQRIHWLEYMDKEAQAEALDHYHKAVSAPDYDTYVKEIAEVTRIVQENFCALGGLRRVDYYAMNSKFSGLYVSSISGYPEFCYLYSNEE